MVGGQPTSFLLDSWASYFGHNGAGRQAARQKATSGGGGGHGLSSWAPWQHGAAGRQDWTRFYRTLARRGAYGVGPIQPSGAMPPGHGGMQADAR